MTEALHEPVTPREVQVEGVFTVVAPAGESAVDIAWLRSVYPRLHSLSSWLREGGRALCEQDLGRVDA